MGTTGSGIKGFIRARRLAFAKSRFERNLAKVIDQANAHRAKGQPAGSQVYKVLYGKADSRVNEFCTKWGVARSDIEAEVPQLSVVRGMCNPGPPTAFIQYGITAVLSMIGIAIACAIFTWVYHTTGVMLDGTVHVIGSILGWTWHCLIWIFHFVLHHLHF